MGGAGAGRTGALGPATGAGFLGAAGVTGGIGATGGAGASTVSIAVGETPAGGATTPVGAGSADSGSAGSTGVNRSRCGVNKSTVDAEADGRTCGERVGSADCWVAALCCVGITGPPAPTGANRTVAACWTGLGADCRGAGLGVGFGTASIISARSRREQPGSVRPRDTHRITGQWRREQPVFGPGDPFPIALARAFPQYSGRARPAALPASTAGQAPGLASNWHCRRDEIPIRDNAAFPLISTGGDGGKARPPTGPRRGAPSERVPRVLRRGPAGFRHPPQDQSNTPRSGPVYPGPGPVP
ncbi:hypothetical protein LV79_006236 [Actinokineospora globicatena]|nr:hypothetical protein [Actinokineospora globicatena]